VNRRTRSFALVPELVARSIVPASRPETSSNAPFPTTRWSQVVAAGDRAGPAAREALAELCAAYWYPLYAFVRRKGRPPEEAADLVQGLFVNLLDRDGLAALEPRRGRFRSFLMAACAHHLADCRDRDRAAKRGGGVALLSFDRDDAERRYAAEPADELTAERLYERRWAISLLDHAVARLEAEAVAAGKATLVSGLLPTLTGGRGEVRLAAIAAELGMTEGAVKTAASRLRRRYGAILREEIARTVADPAEVEEEVRALFAALAR
jgi:DNA-directed RNA polymerase specialized sigma24 family protein